jgi:hypothetical protein
MPKSKKPNPRFTQGQVVYIRPLMRKGEIKKEPFWNGFTWMYSFVGEQSTLGENYISLNFPKSLPGMLVDRVAATQGCIDAREDHNVNSDLCMAVRKMMDSISAPGSVGRPVFNLNDFFAGMGKINFDEYSFSEVATLIECLGESLKSGLAVASNEPKPDKGTVENVLETVNHSQG